MDNTTLFLDPLKGLAQRGKNFHILFVTNGAKECISPEFTKSGITRAKNADQEI